MDPVARDKLLDLIINVISIILGGGLVMLFIEWRRHQRESLNWKREDQRLEVHIPRADMMIRKWQLESNLPDRIKLNIYENKLEGTFRNLMLIADFVIQNTTQAEIVVVKYDFAILLIPPGDDVKRFYDLETGDLMSLEDTGPTKLRPLSALTRQIIFEGRFSKDRRLETLPTTFVVTAETSDGSIVQGRATIKIVSLIPDMKRVGEDLHPKKYADKLVVEPKDETEIPF